jgi:hypothetical protein
MEGVGEVREQRHDAVASLTCSYTPLPKCTSQSVLNYLAF